MSDETELRDRVKSIICRQAGCHIDDADLAAQMVIDDLGLEVEVAAARISEDGVIHCERESRVVGKWES